MDEIKDVKNVALLVDAFRMRNYYAEMIDIADKKIEALVSKLSWSDIRIAIKKSEK